MDDKDKVDPATDYPIELSWSLGGGDSDGVYFFGSNYRDSSILSEFGWNIQPDNSVATGVVGLDRMDYNLAESSTPATSAVWCGGGEPVVEAKPAENTQSVSSSSWEDVPEKSTGSAGSAEKATPETARKVNKIKGVKRVREQRVAFMTKSEIDHLEDGYRWRKYGQKAVKNSPFPRSYYRCTNSNCTVKKRVERSCEDPSIVITTYEGQHCHHTVGFPGGGVMKINYNNNDDQAAFGRQLIINSSSASHYFYNYPAAGPAAGSVLGFPREGTQISSGESTPRLPTDGLLGDIVQLHPSWIPP